MKPSSSLPGEEQEQNNEGILHTLEANWRAEMEGAATYRELAGMELDDRRKGLLVKLAEAEERHARRWSDRIQEMGGPHPASRQTSIGPSRSVILTAKVADLDTALRKTEATEEAHVREYERQAEVLGDPAIAEILHEMARDEASHARTLTTLVGGKSEPQSRLDSILRREKWHGRGGSWIGDAIYGVNDGLTAVFGIVSGVAAASSNNQFIVVAGLAGTLSSALSMGASAYLANKAEREVFEAELAREKQEIDENPEEEREELELFYQLKGFTEEEARNLVERMSRDPEQFLQALAHEELGLSEEQAPKPQPGSRGRDRLHGHRRHRAGAALLLPGGYGGHRRIAGGECGGSLRRGSVQEPGDAAQLVAQRLRDDGGGTPGGCGCLRSGIPVRDPLSEPSSHFSVITS